MDQPKSVTCSCAIYRTLLHLGPAAFRREYQNLMLSDFRHQCLTIYRKRGCRGVFSLWPTLLTHTLRDLSLEYLSQVQQYIRKLRGGIAVRMRTTGVLAVIIPLIVLIVLLIPIALGSSITLIALVALGSSIMLITSLALETLITSRNSLTELTKIIGINRKRKLKNKRGNRSMNIVK